MGNQFVYEEYDDPEGPGEGVAFFQDLNLKWLKHFTSRIVSITGREIDMEEPDEKLEWINYFRIFSDMRTVILKDVEVKKRKVWHPATLGYAMVPYQPVHYEEEIPPPPVVKEIEDDHTDDSASEGGDDGDNDDSDEGGEQQKDNSEDKSKDKSSASKRSEVGSAASKSDAGSTGTAAGEVVDNGRNKTGSIAMKEQKDELAAADFSGASSSSSSSSSSGTTVDTLPENRMRNKDPNKRNWDSTFINPMFFGHSYMRQSVLDNQKKEESNRLLARENRAIDKARSARGNTIDSSERMATLQEQARIKKMDNLEMQYEKARKKAEAELEANKRDLLPVAFTSFRHTWEIEYRAAEEAYEMEMSEMKKVHEQKTKADKDTLRKRREELEAFKDAENQQIPAAERLEEFARIEISRAIKEVDDFCVEMEKARADYIEMKVDTEQFENASASMSMTAKAREDQLTEMKELVVIAESNMKDKMRQVETAIEGLLDAEALLQRALRIKSQQDELLPLFQLMAGPIPLPSECPLHSFIIAVIILMKGPFEQKFSYLMRLFDPYCDDFFTAELIVKLAVNVLESLRLLKFTPFAIGKSEVANIVERGFMALGLNYKEDKLTEYETKQLVKTMTAHSYLLCRVFGISNNTSMSLGAITFDPSGITSNMSTYQRNRMMPFAQLTAGMINANIFKSRMHASLVRNRPQLTSAAKQVMHERSIAMGYEDPLRADYSKFLEKPEAANKYRVDPLFHGHLGNSAWVERRTREEAAVRIQAFYRSFSDRKIAALAARYAAFMEAKASALREMKKKVIKEFKKRESGKGMGKMKWDAQVRMKQAKLRSMGAAVSRADAVMNMMEEAISTAKDDIEARFAVLEAKEDFSGLIAKPKVEPYEPSRDNLDVEAMFGVLLPPQPPPPKEKKKKQPSGDSSNKQKEKNGKRGRSELEQSENGDKQYEDESEYGADKKSKTEQQQDDFTGPEDEGGEGGQVDDEDDLSSDDGEKVREEEEEPETDENGNSLPIMAKADADGNGELNVVSVMNQLHVRMIVEGRSVIGEAMKLAQDAIKAVEEERQAEKDQEIAAAAEGGEAALAVVGKHTKKGHRHHHHHAKTISIPGETDSEYSLRMMMELSEPAVDIQHSLINRLRALNRAVTLFKSRELLAELPSKRLLLQYIHCHSDKFLEYELKMHFQFKGQYSALVASLRKLVSSDMEFGSLLHHRLNAILHNSERGLSVLFENELHKISSVFSSALEVRLATNETAVEENIIADELERLNAFVTKYNGLVDNMFVTMAEDHAKFNRLLIAHHEVSKRYRSIVFFRDTKDGHKKHEDVPLDMRQNWLYRITSVQKLQETSEKQKQLKYSEIRNVCREFLETAAQYAPIVIAEHNQPKYRKTLRICSEHKVHGRVAESGRGHDGGLWYKYETQGIIFRVCEDCDAVFNGSDELAAKAGGNERLASLEYFRLKVPKLHTPLVATIDYMGYRVVCESKLPVQNIDFTEDGEVRKISENKVLGVVRFGDEFVNSSKMTQNLLKMAANRLNLAEHQCRGSKDIAASRSWCSADMEVFKSSSDEYYMHNTWHAFPPEVPEETPHLRPTPRDHSTLWRMLRPEFVKNYHEPLSPDAFSLITATVPDNKEQCARVTSATKELIQKHIPGFLDNLLRREYDLPLTEGLGLKLSDEMHTAGINMRHLGLMRSLLWRELPGVCNLFFAEQQVRSAYDWRPEVQEGDTIFVVGKPRLPEPPVSAISKYDHPPQHDHGSDAGSSVPPGSRQSSVQQSANVSRRPSKFGGEGAVLSADDAQSRKNSSSKKQAEFARKALEAASKKPEEDPHQVNFLCKVSLAEGKKSRITEKAVPVDTRYMGASLHGLIARSGHVSVDFVTDPVCEKLRLLLLGEMLARSVKHIIRLQMRGYNKKFKTNSPQFFRSLVIEYLNLLTCASVGTASPDNGDQIYQDILYEAVRSRFGDASIRPSERYNLSTYVHPILPYTVSRLLHMLGVKLHITCRMDFTERPVKFLFSTADVLEVSPVVKHNIPIMSFADGVIASLQAQALDKQSYIQEVLDDKPSIFYTFSERKGCRIATNRGSLGHDWNGHVNKGVELESPGPIISDKFIRSYDFDPQCHPFIDVKFSRQIVAHKEQNHFSAEAHFRCTGLHNYTRVICMCGRFAMTISRDNWLTVTYSEGVHDLNIKVCPVEYSKWIHAVVSWDGVTVRCYVDSKLIIRLEIAEILRGKRKADEQEFKEKRKQLRAAEKGERVQLRTRVELDAQAFFQTKEGTSLIKKTSAQIMESDAFQDENIGEDAKDKATMMKMKRIEATKRAKERYTAETYEVSIHELADRYKQLRIELQDHEKKKYEEGQMRVFIPLRIGAATQDANTRKGDGSNFFCGQITCVAVYPECLSAARVHTHYLTAVSTDRRSDAHRMHAVAATMFHDAMRQLQDDEKAIEGYAASLVGALRAEDDLHGEQRRHGRLYSKLRISEIILLLKQRAQLEGIAQIMKLLPREHEYADLATKGFLSIRDVDRSFFSKCVSVSRRDMIYMPFEFGLVSVHNPPAYLEAAAFIFQEVVKDPELMFVYGELDLRFLPEIQNAPLVVSLVVSAREDEHLRIIRLTDAFKAAGMSEQQRLTAISDEDVVVLSRGLPASEGIDLTNSTLLTDTSMDHINRMINMKIINIAGCRQITNRGLKNIQTLYPHLQVLNIEGLTSITDEGLLPIATNCKKLRVINVNRCPLISSEVLVTLITYNRYLTTLHASGTVIDDNGLSLISSALSGRDQTVTSVDLSFCRDISDFGIQALSEACPGIKHLNLCGLSRVSDAGCRAVVGNCWYLSYLNLEDIFLLRDTPFFFSVTQDGRRAANENMLKSLVTLNMTDCVNVTDHGIEGLAERNRVLQHLILKACDKLTDKSLTIMADPQSCMESNLPMCDTLLSLCLANSSGFTGAGIIRLLPHCPFLAALDLSGLANVVDDEFVAQLCQARPTIQKLVVQKCVFLTDVALCNIAEHLWMEYIDISGCHRVTDEGVEVVAIAFVGLIHFVGNKLKRLTPKAVKALRTYCKQLYVLETNDCPLIEAAGAHFAAATTAASSAVAGPGEKGPAAAAASSASTAVAVV